jgi:hypothetical protein
MAFALWIDDEEGLAWAQGTHEYRPMGAAVIAVTDRFRLRDFQNTLRHPPRLDRSFAGFFASLEEVNHHLRVRDRPLREQSKTRVAARKTAPKTRVTPHWVR